MNKESINNRVIIRLKRKISPSLIKLTTCFSPTTVTKYLYYKSYNQKINLKKPQKFNEKLQWLKLNAFNDLVVCCADKYNVRSYVEDLGLTHILCRLEGVYSKSSEIDFDKLPNKFVLKCTHGCGYNIICQDKKTLDIKEVKEKLDKWLKEKYGYQTCEPHYLKMKPLIICEEFLEDSIYENLIDYKIYCFNGLPQYTLVCLDRGSSIKKVFYDLEWNKTSLRKDSADIDIEKPICYEEMLDYAKKLSSPFHFVRVDFYNVNNKPILGELTFTPAACLSTEYTEEGELLLGQLLKLPNEIHKDNHNDN